MEVGGLGHETLSLSPKSRAGATLSSLLSHAKRAGAAEAYGSDTECEEAS